MATDLPFEPLDEPNRFPPPPVPVSDGPTESLIAALTALATALAGPSFRLGLGHADSAEPVRTELKDQITDYLVPRLRRLDAPLLAVLGGSTGSGKSTITNSLARSNVSPAGVLRPTTRAPVLICHPGDEGWFVTADLLPELPRVTGNATATGQVLHVKPVASMAPGLALIDAPDIDSVEGANRELATQLLAAADLWIFVTTAVRYADAVPWDFLRRAQERGTALALVINRMPSGAAGEIVPHLEAMLQAANLDRATVYPIDEGALRDGRLSDKAVAQLRGMIEALAADAGRRAEIVRSTLDGALASIPARARVVHAAALEQDAAVADLAAVVQRTYAETAETLAADLSGGALLRGEVLDRWQELIGTGELMRAVQSRISWLRDRVAAALSGRTSSTNAVKGEITSTLEQLLIDNADAAALRVTSNWRQMPGGPAVLGTDRSLDRSSAQVRDSFGSEIRAWQDDILELVRSRGAGKRNTARVLALGVNGVGVALMIVIFAQTGGITGGEVAVASGTAGVSQALLNALFGEQAVRDLANEARRLLLERIHGLLVQDASRFDAAVRATGASGESTGRLDQAITEFDRVRRATRQP